MPNDEGREMSVVDHLEELRLRLLISLAVVAAASVLCYIFSLDAIQFLTRGAGKIQYLGPTDAFMVRLKVSVIMGLAVSSPVVFWQLWLFVAPGLYRNEKRYALPTIISAVVLFFGGGAFGVFTVPYALRVLQKFGGDVLQANYTVDRFISFATGMILAFAVVFELPLVLIFLAKIGIVSHKMLSRSRKYVILIIFAVSAVLTPGTDIVSMMIMAAPLYILFEISLLIIRFIRPAESQRH
ncbi:MAG: twin-arginine translocase subunit TatC [bacterium]